MQVRDRIKELRRVKANRLRPHPKNWRTHPDHQRDALRGILAEIGYAGALLARQRPDGSLELIDGHLRAETTPDAEVPVLILDLTDEETDKLLALHDPLAGLAEANRDVLAELLAGVETENDAVRGVIDNLLATPPWPAENDNQHDLPEVPVRDTYQVVVECNGEDEQKALYERLTSEGWKCRLLTL